MPLLTGGGSLLVAVVALRIARRGQERETRARDFDLRRRIAAELFLVVAIRERRIDSVPESAGGAHLFRVKADDDGSNRAEGDAIVAGATLATLLEGQSAEEFSLLFDWLMDKLSYGKEDDARVALVTARSMIELWVSDPEVMLALPRVASS